MVSFRLEEFLYLLQTSKAIANFEMFNAGADTDDVSRLERDACSWKGENDDEDIRHRIR